MMAAIMMKIERIPAAISTTERRSNCHYHNNASLTFYTCHPIYRRWQNHLSTSMENQGRIALHKCNWHLIAWELSASHLSLVLSTPTTVIMRDCHRSPSTIQFLSQSQPNVGLGLLLCSDSTQLPHYHQTYKGVVHLCWLVAGSHNMSEQEMRLLLHQHLLPKMSYTLHGNLFTVQQCSKLNSVIQATFLPGLGLNRHFPSVVLTMVH
jgi:hypothetical protein